MSVGERLLLAQSRRLKKTGDTWSILSLVRISRSPTSAIFYQPQNDEMQLIKEQLLDDFS
jgi:hypothetical protein